VPEPKALFAKAFQHLLSLALEQRRVEVSHHRGNAAHLHSMPRHLLVDSGRHSNGAGGHHLALSIEHLYPIQLIVCGQFGQEVV
jgi:hypothetical protein